VGDYIAFRNAKVIEKADVLGSPAVRLGWPKVDGYFCS
jgi:hypothetical protein